MKILKKKSLLLTNYKNVKKIFFSRNVKKNQAEFPSAYSMIKSKKLDWSPTKIKKNFKIIRESGDFALDQRKVKSTVSKLT